MRNARCGTAGGEITSGMHKANVVRESARRRRGQRESKMLSDGVRPGSDALSAENSDNDLRTGRATRASSDIAARRKSAGRVVPRRKIGRRRARNARCGVECGEITSGAAKAMSRMATPRDGAGDGVSDTSPNTIYMWALLI